MVRRNRKWRYMCLHKQVGIRLCPKRRWKFYLVPLELQACPIWCKIPQVRANDLSRGESEEDLEIGDVPSSCLLHDREVDGDLGAVGGVPTDGAGRGEHPPATRGTRVTPLVSSWLCFPPWQFLRGQDWDQSGRDAGKSLVMFFWHNLYMLTHVCLGASVFSFCFCTPSLLHTLRHDFNFARRGNMSTWTAAGVSWTLRHFLERGLGCENPNGWDLMMK